VLSRRGLASCPVLVLVAGSLSACLRPRVVVAPACGRPDRYEDGRPGTPTQDAALVFGICAVVAESP